jgi:hypothetical protein
MDRTVEVEMAARLHSEQWAIRILALRLIEKATFFLLTWAITRFA